MSRSVGAAAPAAHAHHSTAAKAAIPTTLRLSMLELLPGPVERRTIAARARIGPRMTASLPGELIEVFERSVTAEHVTIDAQGHPVVWPVAPAYHAAKGCIDVTREAGQAADCSANPHVALLFCDSAGLDAAP